MKLHTLQSDQESKYERLTRLYQLQMQTWPGGLLTCLLRGLPARLSSASVRCEFINAGIWLVNMTLMNRVDQSQSGHRRRNGIVIPWSIQFEDLCRLKMLEMKKTSNARGTPMEDDLKILKVEYLSIHWSDFLQILNLSSGDQTKFKNAWN